MNARVLDISWMGPTWGRSSLPALLGLLPPLIMLTITQGPSVWWRLAIVLAVALALNLLFSRIRRQELSPYGLVTAGLVALLVPESTPLYQLLLGSLFGILIGEQVFGGRGRSFLNPVVVTLAFLTFSFADQDYRAGPGIPFWSLLPALFLLVLAGQAAWRILAAAAATLVLLGALAGDAAPWMPLIDGGLVLVLLYLACDPASAACTNPGRWVYGALFGALTILLAQVGPLFGAAVFAVLLATIFAPLIDRIVIALHARWREARRG